MDRNEKSEGDLSVSETGSEIVGPYEHYVDGESFCLGCAQIILGELSVLTWACAVYFEAETDQSGATFQSHALVCAGVMAGMYMLIPGAFGIISSQRKTKETIVAFLGLSIAAVFPVSLFYLTWSIYSLVMGLMPPTLPLPTLPPLPDARPETPYGCILGTYVIKEGTCARHRGLLAAYGVCAGLALVHLALAIRSIVVCCSCLCGGKPQIPDTEIPLTKTANEKSKPPI